MKIENRANLAYGMFMLAIALIVIGEIISHADSIKKSHWVGPDGTVMGATRFAHNEYLARYAMLDAAAIGKMEELERIRFVGPTVPVEVVNDFGGCFEIRITGGDLKDETGFVLARDLRQGITQ